MRVGQHAPVSDVDAFARRISDLDRRIHDLELRAGRSASVAWGVVPGGFKEITTTSASFTAITDIAGLSVSFTAVANRRYKIDFVGHPTSDTAGDRIEIWISDGTPTQLQRWRSTAFVANVAQSASAFVVQEPDAGPVTYKIRGRRDTGSGTCALGAGSTIPAQIVVTDIGPAL